MLEIVIAGTMLAGVMTSLSVVMRTARQSWEMNDRESGSLHQMHAVSRHFVRVTREARAVTAINSKDVTLEMRDGSTTQWAWKSNAQGLADVVTVTSSTDNVENVLAEKIQSIQFAGFDADGVTAVTDVDDIRVLTIDTSVALVDAAAASQRVQSKAWIRSW